MKTKGNEIIDPALRDHQTRLEDWRFREFVADLHLLGLFGVASMYASNANCQ